MAATRCDLPDLHIPGLTLSQGEGEKGGLTSALRTYVMKQAGGDRTLTVVIFITFLFSGSSPFLSLPTSDPDVGGDD